MPTSMTHRNIVVLLFAIAAMSSACREDQDLPDEPVINEVSFNSLDKNLHFRFTDGDGDVGLGPGDTLSPFQPDPDAFGNPTNRFYFNLWIDYFEKIDGEWVQVLTASPIDFRVPVLTPQGQNKQLRVKVTYDMGSFLPFITAQSDTIKLSVRIADRSLHLSNIAETPPFYLSD